MNRKLFLFSFFLFSSFAFSAPQPDMSSWSKYDVVTLKRNQSAQFHLVIDGIDKFLTFRWTLYVNDGLVMLYDYEKFKYQNVLYLDYSLDGFRINLKNRAEDAFDYPYVLIVFSEFDKKKQEVMFTVLFKDDKRTILVERIAPKEE